MMQEPSFDTLASEAAAGLRGDRELYLEIKEELQTHLEDKAAQYARDGHDEEESVALAKQSFGSPLDMAAELVEANRGRMRLRGLLRLGFNALIIPLAIVLALYVGYGRFARLQVMVSRFNFDSSNPPTQLPTLPFFGIEDYPADEQVSTDANSTVGKSPTSTASAKNADKYAVLRQLRGNEQNAKEIRNYWETHRSDPDSNIYFAYYTLYSNAELPAFRRGARSAQEKEARYVAEIRQGEQIEPQNALYNITLATYYLQTGMISKEERPNSPEVPQTDEVLNRRAFELGIAELQRAARKPYLHTYQMEVLAKRLNVLPAPRLTEDYLQQVTVSSSVLFPEFAKWRSLARRIPGCARLLLAEGRRADAEAVMDAWKPFTLQLVQDSTNQSLIKVLVSVAIARMLSKSAADIYGQLGATDKATEARSTFTHLEKVYAGWQKARQYTAGNRFEMMMHDHAPILTNLLLPVFGNMVLSVSELMPGRMHEHVIIEETAVQGVLLLLMLALLGTLCQGVLWLYQMRRAAAIPFLLLPPAKEIMRALLLGIVLPMAIYWVYSRLPGIGGREFGWSSDMRTRFIIEIVIVGFIMLWLPAFLLKRYIHRRCEDLGISRPTRKEERISNWKVRGAIFAALLLIAVAVVFAVRTDETYPLLGATLLAIGIIYAAVRYAVRKRHEHGLYYGTLARSMATVYAFAIIFLSLTAQPWLLYNEAQWLRKDTVCFGHFADKHQTVAGFTPVEIRAAQKLNGELLAVMEGKK